MIQSIIAQLLTVGGLGYINYAIVNQLGAAEPHGDTKTSQIATGLGWSIVDYAIYLLVDHFLSVRLGGSLLLVANILGTIVVSFVITLLIAKPLQKFLYWCYNEVFKLNHENTIDIGTIWSNFFTSDKTTEVYCYDLQHNPIGQGFLNTFSKIRGEYDLTLQPFKKDQHKKQWSYDEIEEISQNPENWDNYTIRQYVNIRENLIIFIIRK